MKNHLKFYRSFFGKTQQQVAKEAGFSQPKLSNIERGITDPSERDKKVISVVLGIHQDALFSREKWNMERRFFSCAEIATYLGFSEKTIRRMIDRKEIPSARIGKSIRIDMRKLTNILESESKEISGWMNLKKKSRW